jgi:hypothetical protein
MLQSNRRAIHVVHEVFDATCNEGKRSMAPYRGMAQPVGHCTVNGHSLDTLDSRPVHHQHCEPFGIGIRLLPLHHVP